MSSDTENRNLTNASEGRDGIDDFQSPTIKKPRTVIDCTGESTFDNPPANAEDQGPSNDEEDDENSESECCPICFETWTTSGFHRLCSLKCGHLFGKRCIERWLSTGKTKCPQCNDPAKRSDIRVLYTRRKLIAMDTSERDGLLKQLEEERIGRRMALEAEARATIALRVALAQLEQSKKELERLKGSFLAMPIALDWVPKFSDKPRKFLLSHQPSHQCRVLSFDPFYNVFLATRSSNVQGGPSGVVKFSLMDCSTDFISIHCQPLRALCHSPFKDGLILTTGNDNSLALATIQSNVTLQTYSLEAVGWSCAFHPSDRNIIFAGLSNGKVNKFDLRNTSQAVDTFKVDFGVPNRNLPIHTIIPLKDSGLACSSVDGIGGFCGSQEGGAWSWKSDRRATCTSLSYDEDSDSAFLTYRMMPTNLPGTHYLLKDFCKNLERRAEGHEALFSPSEFSSESGQKIWARSTIFSYQRDSGFGPIAAIPDEVSASIQLYDLSVQGEAAFPLLLAKVYTNSASPLLDVVHSKTSEDGHIIGALSEHSLYLTTQNNRLIVNSI